MLPDFLVPEITVREAGTSQDISLGDQRGQVLILTLGITRIIEQESIDVSIWGSPDGADWGSRPLASFSQKFYCGTYQIMVDLTNRPDVKYLRAKWAVNRWGKGETKPLFTVYLFAQEMQDEVFAAAAS